jgi:hypothetical protein
MPSVVGGLGETIPKAWFGCSAMSHIVSIRKQKVATLAKSSVVKRASVEQIV